MSARIYRLLRNNKEEGPFTSEELIQKKLRPYDLIWIDGRSAAWSYPGELAEFKNDAPLPGENQAKQADRQQSPSVSPSVQAAMAVSNSLAQPVIKEKPRYKVSAAWSKIQTVTTPISGRTITDKLKPLTSKKIVESKQASGEQAKSLSWEEAWLDWEKEKTTPPGEAVSNAKPNNTKTVDKNHTPELETKYEESIDSLKDKYIENILQQKRKSNRSFSLGKISEFILPSLALIVIFSIGYWLLHKTDVLAPASINAPAKSTQPVVTSNENQPALNMNDNNAPTTSTAPVEKEKQKVDATSANEPLTHAEDRKAVNKRIDKSLASSQANRPKVEKKLITAKISSPVASPAARPTTVKPVKQTDTSSYIKASKNNVAADHAKTDVAGMAANQPSEKEAPAVKRQIEKSGTDYVNVPQYIALTDGYASLTIRNISDINLDLAVIDLQYYDASNHFRKGETIYLHNLKAGKSVMVKTPKDINSMYATSKISLVSADAENVYVVGDN